MQPTPDQLKLEKERAARETKEILTNLENDYPGITEGIATALGAGAGAAGSFTALVFAGTTGLSAAGITSGLAAAGSVVGGGMLAGIGVLAAPVALLGVAGYALAKKHKTSKLAVALSTAISNLYDILERLQTNAEYYRDEITSIRAIIDNLRAKQKA